MGSGAVAVSASASATSSTFTSPSPTATPDSAGSSVDVDNPWLGLASFTEESQRYFFGREGEVAELTRQVQRKLLTVLFGKSGLGKTSILRAGLVPRLRAQGYFPVYLRIDYGHDSPEPGEQIKQAINRAARDLGGAGDPESEVGGRTRDAEGEAGRQWTRKNVAVPGESIWEFLHHRDDRLKDASGQTLIPLLIFDQFEELFTLAQSDEFGRIRASKFIEELSDLVENRPPKALEAKLDTEESIAERFDFSRSDYRVVIALREDYLAPLEGLKKVMPSLAQNRLRLAPMTGSQALEAVLQPGNRLRPTKPLVSEEVAEAIVRFVAGGSELANAEVEPSLLSLICRELNEQRIAQGRSEISQDLLAGSHETILSNFYERSFSDQPDSLRRIIEDDLLTESGYRENLAEESLLKRFQAAGAAPDALAKLVNRRLLRIEERLDVRRVELTHDVLTGVVKASRDQRHEREAKEATERALAEQQAREQAAQRALRRARAVAAGCTLLAAVAIAAAIFAFVSFRQARQAELMVRQARAVSEQARQQAEALLGFLTDDFVRELETFGRYQTIAELSQREIDYFQHLPAALKDPETIRSGALALVHHGEAVRLLGDLGTAVKNAVDAEAVLEKLRRDGDRSDSIAVVLARAYTEEDIARSSAVVFDTALAAAAQRSAAGNIRAVDLLRPLAEKAHAPSEARRAYLEALSLSGYEALSGLRANYDEAMRLERQALQVAAQLDADHQSDLVSTAYEATAADWLGEALAGVGRYDEARSEEEYAVATADRVLAQRPQLGVAMITKRASQQLLAVIDLDELNPVEGLRFALQSVQSSLALIGVEPKNSLYRHNLANAYVAGAEAMWASGRLSEVIDYRRKAVETYGPVDPIYTIYFAELTAALQAHLGDFSGAAATDAAADADLAPSAVRNFLVSGSRDARTLIDAWRACTAATIAYERGEFAAARRIARDALARLEALPPGGVLQSMFKNAVLASLSSIAGYADYDLGDFTAAARAQNQALQTTRTLGEDTALSGGSVADRRSLSGITIWLSMALAREGNRQEAARTIGPVVAMYRTLDKQNHGDQWLPLEFAEALYAQSLADPPHRAALLHEASGLVDHLIPAIARLHDTREWRARIEAAQRTSSGGAAP